MFSTYAVSKVAGFHMTKFYRDRHSMFALSGILFNHESPRRSTEFVTRKITQSVSRIAIGKQKTLVLGNIDAQRDWGYSPEYVSAMHSMMQLDSPSDYCIATGETHTVRDFVEESFNHVGLDWKNYTTWDSDSLKRPNEVSFLLGDYSKANSDFGWEPKTKFKELVK